jgi:integrase
MKGGIRATVKVAGFQRERRFNAGTPSRVVKAWKAHVRNVLTKRHSAATDRPKPKDRGTLRADAERYYPLIKHHADWVSRRSEIRAWLASRVGTQPRHVITKNDLMTIRGEWVQSGIAPKTINNRVTALRDLYRKLDGDDEPTPCDGIPPLHRAKTPPQIVPADVVNAVIDRLLVLATLAQPGTYQRGRPAIHARQDRARLMVLATTGKRPCEVARALPADVDMLRRVWAVRDAKGGWSEGVYLNDEMRMAWAAFIEAEAWGAFPVHFEKRLQRAGWPRGVRIYNVRHSTWIEASERGADLSDIQAGAGHRNIRTTREHYVPVLHSRMQRLSELLEGRFGWRTRLAPLSDDGKHTVN